MCDLSEASNLLLHPFCHPQLGSDGRVGRLHTVAFVRFIETWGEVTVIKWKWLGRDDVFGEETSLQ